MALRKSEFNVRPTVVDPVLAILMCPKLSVEDIPSGIFTSRLTFRFPALMPSIEVELRSLTPESEKRDGSDMSRKEVGRALDELLGRRGGGVVESGGAEKRLSSIRLRNKSIEERGRRDKRQWEPEPELDGLVWDLRLGTKEDEGSSVIEDSGRVGFVSCRRKSIIASGEC